MHNIRSLTFLPLLTAALIACLAFGGCAASNAETRPEEPEDGRSISILHPIGNGWRYTITLDGYPMRKASDAEGMIGVAAVEISPPWQWPASLVADTEIRLETADQSAFVIKVLYDEHGVGYGAAWAYSHWVDSGSQGSPMEAMCVHVHATTFARGRQVPLLQLNAGAQTTSDGTEAFIAIDWPAPPSFTDSLQNVMDGSCLSNVCLASISDKYLPGVER